MDKKNYCSEQYGLCFTYPSNWEKNPNYVEKYSGEDGYFIVAKIQSKGKSIDEVVSQETMHTLHPFGMGPVVQERILEGMSVRIIIPSEDQEKYFEKQAAIIIAYPEVLKVLFLPYDYVIIWVDKNHIDTILEDLSFMPSATAPIG